MIGVASNLSEEDKILFEFSKNEVINAISTINDFSKSMITVVSGFFVAYFALLKFLGLGEDIQLSSLIDPNYCQKTKKEYFSYLFYHN